MYENDLQKFIIDPATSIKNHQSPDYPYLAHPSNLFEEKRKKEIKSEERNETKIFPSKKKRKKEQNEITTTFIPFQGSTTIVYQIRNFSKFIQIHPKEAHRRALRFLAPTILQKTTIKNDILKRVYPRRQMRSLLLLRVNWRKAGTTSSSQAFY